MGDRHSLRIQQAKIFSLNPSLPSDIKRRIIHEKALPLRSVDTTWDNGAANGAGIPSNTRWGVNVATVGGTGSVDSTEVATVYVLTITSGVTISSIIVMEV